MQTSTRLRLLVAASIGVLALPGCGFLLGGFGPGGPGDLEPVGPERPLGDVRVFGGEGSYTIIHQENRAGGACMRWEPGGGASCWGGGGDVGPGPREFGGGGGHGGGDETCREWSAGAEIVEASIDTGDGRTTTLKPLEHSLEVLGYHVFAACWARMLDFDRMVITGFDAAGNEAGQSS